MKREQLILRVKPELFATLTAVAEREEISRNELICDILTRELKSEMISSGASLGHSPELPFDEKL